MADEEDNNEDYDEDYEAPRLPVRGPSVGGKPLGEQHWVHPRRAGETE